MDIETSHRTVTNGEMLREEDYDRLRALREQINDILEIQSGLEEEYVETKSFGRASGPAFAIVVGHTRNSKGAAGGEPINEREYPWNKDLAEMILSECMDRNVESKIFYRDKIGISGAYKQVLEWGASCVVELHFNSSSPAGFGTETLYDNGTNLGSKAWAQRLQDGMVGLYDRKKSDKSDRGVKERDAGDRGYASVSAIDIPSAIIEPFFGNHPVDAKLGQKHKRELAEIIAEAAASQLLID